MEEEEQPHKTIASVLKDLEPIRDLAKNWDIDIASCLEEYLYELEHAGGGELGVTSMDEADEVKPNFAQAALLLHNSSHVYSRKVEYLYKLVFQALEGLSAVNSSQKRASKGRASDPEIEDFLAFDPGDQFLLLDDVLPTDKSEDCRHINLAPTAADQERRRRYSAMSSATSTPHANVSMRTQNLSGSTMAKSFHTLGVSKALNQINTQSSAVLRLMDGQCDLDPSGRLLLPGCQSQSSTTPPVQVPRAEQEYAPEGGHYSGDNNDDYDDDGPGFMMADDDDVNAAGDDVNQEIQAPQTAKKRVTFAPEAVPEVEPERPDPWAMLDPHTSDTRKSRPLKLGKTLKLPAGVDDLPSDCVTGSNTRKWKVAVPLPPASADSKFFATEAFHALSRKRRLEDDDEEEDIVPGDLPMVPLKGLVYGEEFAYLAREHAQRKAADRRHLRRVQQQRAKEARRQMGAQNHNAFGDDDDDDFGGGYGFGDDDDDDDVGPVDNGGGSPVVETNTGLQAMEEVYRNRSEDETDSVVDARAFEALCRAHIAKFAKGAEKYASETQLTQRVDQWQEKLEPILAEEEERPEFDIHEYGHSILVSVEKALEVEHSNEAARDDKPPMVDFEKVTKDCPGYQICRYFLATLCLCNAGNVLLEQEGGTTDALGIKLLSTDYSRPMEAYQAPSVVEEHM